MADQNFSIKIDVDAGQAQAQSAKLTKSVKDLGKAQEYLNKINTQAKSIEDPLYAVRANTQKELKRLNELLATGAITAKQYSAAHANLIKIQNAQLASMKGLGGGFRSLRGAAGQFGYQVQDVAVQLQMGQNAMLVFAQQGSQIASIFGPSGQIVGAFIAVAGALAMAFIPSLKESKEKVEDLREEFETLSNTLNGFGTSARIGVDALKALDELKLAENQKKLNDEQERFNDLTSASFTDAFKSTKEREQDINISRAKIAVLEAEQESLKKGIKLRKDGMLSLKAQQELEKELSDKVKEANIRNVSALELYERQIEKMTKGSVERNRAEAHLNTLRDLEERKQAEEDMVASMEAASERQIAAQKKVVENEKIAHQERLASALYMLKQMNEAEKEANSVFDTLGYREDKTAELEGNYIAQLELLKKYQAQGINLKRGYAAVQAEIEQKMADDAIGQGRRGIDELAKYNKKAFRISKAINTAEAIMNTYTGVTKALTGMTPPWSYIAAAGTLAYGMAQVAGIKAQTFSGRAAGGMVQAGQPYMVGEMGKEMFIPNTGGRIVNNRDTEAGLGVTNINFTINAVDARGFDQLLNSRRGQIVNMVNQAMNDRGRMGVTA